MAKTKIVETKKVHIESEVEWGTYRGYGGYGGYPKKSEVVKASLTLKTVYNVLTKTFSAFQFVINKKRSEIIFKAETLTQLHALHKVIGEMIKETEKLLEDKF